MLSFFGNFTTQELADIKLASQNEKYFYTCVLNYAKNKDDDLARKVQNFLERINAFSDNCKLKGVYLSLEEFVRQSEYITKTYALVDGLQRAETIEKFVNIFKNADFNYNIQAFLAFAQEENKEIKTPSYTEGEVDCVNITTIHASKGLEYPIVFVVQAGADLTKTPQKAEIKIHDSLGVGLKFYNTEEFKKETSFVFDAIDETIKEEEFAELQRLLYVGLTRAKEYLYIYGTTNSLQYAHFEKKYEIMFSKTYLDLIMNSLPNEDLQNILSNKQTEITKEKVSFVVNFFDDKMRQTDKENKIVVFSKGDEKLKNQLLESLAFEYPNKEVFSIALKNSVSSLLQSDEYASQNHVPNKLVLSEHLAHEEEKALLGTMYHKILFEADFNNCSITDLSTLKEKLACEDEVAKEIDLQKVCQAIELVKKLTNNQPLQKEKKFIMKVPYNMVAKSKLQDEILVQGIIDLFSFGEKNVLIDYKLTSMNDDEKIVRKYEKQILLYKQALILAFNKQDIESYIIDIDRSKIIKIN